MGRLQNHIYHLYSHAYTGVAVYAKKNDGRWYPCTHDLEVVPDGAVFDDIRIFCKEKKTAIVYQNGRCGIMNYCGEMMVPIEFQKIEYDNGAYVCTVVCADGSYCYQYYVEYGDSGCPFETDTKQKVIQAILRSILLCDSDNVYTFIDGYEELRYEIKQKDALFFPADGEGLSPCPYQGQSLVAIVVDEQPCYLLSTQFLACGDLLETYYIGLNYFYLRVQRGEKYMLLGRSGKPLLTDWVDGVVPFRYTFCGKRTVAHTAIVRQAQQTTLAKLPVDVV